MKAQNPKLHHRSEPIPGIYMQDADVHYLVAMRRKKGSSNDESLFIPLDGFDTKDESTSDIVDASRLSRPSLSRHGSVFSMDSVASANTSTTVLDKTMKDTLSAVDICGYRSLRRPIEVEWNSIHQRWMFSEEVALRTIIIDLCTSKECRSIPYACLCKAKTPTKLFALDDGSSFITIKDDITKQKIKNGLAKGSMLWTYDARTGALRQQSTEEALVSRKALTQRPRHFLCEDDKSSYLRVVDYASRCFVDG